MGTLVEAVGEVVGTQAEEGEEVVVEEAGTPAEAAASMGSLSATPSTTATARTRTLPTTPPSMAHCRRSSPQRIECTWSSRWHSPRRAPWKA